MEKAKLRTRFFANLFFLAGVIIFTLTVFVIVKLELDLGDVRLSQDIVLTGSMILIIIIGTALLFTSNVLLLYTIRQLQDSPQGERKQTQEQDLPLTHQADLEKIDRPLKKNDSEISIVKLQLEELEDILKGTRQNMFNVMLDPNGINSPEDMQSALDLIEESLVCLKRSLEGLK